LEIKEHKETIEKLEQEENNLKEKLKEAQELQEQGLLEIEGLKNEIKKIEQEKADLELIIQGV